MVTQATHLARSTGTSYTLTHATGTNYTLVQSSDSYANYLDSLLAESVWWIDSHQATASETIPNLGTGGTALDALNGGGTAITTNDAKWLEYAAADGAYVYLPGVASNYLSVPDAAALDIVGDIDLRVKVAMDDWTPSADNNLLHKLASPQRSYALQVGTTGSLIFYWSNDGTSVLSAISTAATGLSDGATKWVRATLDVDNGAAGRDVKFWMSDDGASWTQLGSTVTSAGVTSIYAGTGVLGVGANAGGAGQMSGKFYRAIVKDGIDGTTVLDVDTSVLTDGGATSFTATTGQTVTITRGTTGRKSTVVHGGAGGGSKWLLGSDDFLETPDDALLDFGASDSFTVLAVHRAWATQGTNDVLLAKKADTTATTAGWSLTGGSSTALQGQSQIGDGTNGITAVSGSRTSGALATVAAVRSVSDDTLTTYLSGTAGSPVTDTTTATLANAEVMRVGRLSGAGTEYADMELVAAIIWRRALTAAEITAVSNYFTTRTHAE